MDRSLSLAPFSFHWLPDSKAPSRKLLINANELTECGRIQVERAVKGQCFEVHEGTEGPLPYNTREKGVVGERDKRVVQRHILWIKGSTWDKTHTKDQIIGLSKERPMVIDSLNLNLSQISSFMHIYRFADFNRFVDLQILADFLI